MPYTIGEKQYKLFKNEGARVMYAGPSNSVTARDTITLLSSQSQASENNPGSLNGTCRVQRGVAVGDIQRLATISASSTLPVGMAGADVDTMIADFRAFVASAYFVDLVKGGIVNLV